MFDSTEQAWADLQIFLDGNLIVGAQAIADQIQTQDQALFAAGRNPHGIQSGNKSYTGSISMLFSDYNNLVDAAHAKGYADITDVRGINIVCTYSPIGAQTLHTRVYELCKFYQTGTTVKQGDKTIVFQLPFNCMNIKENS